MGFQLVPKSVTLNDLKRRNGVILRCFSEFGYLPGALRKSSRSLSHLLMSSCYRRQGGYVFVVVCLYVCLLATLRKNFRTYLYEIFRKDWQWANEQTIKF